MRESCPCGNKKTYMQCCQRLIAGKKQARTAKELMQSRYTAFVKKKAAYLMSTVADNAAKGFDKSSIIDSDIKWIGLQIHRVVQGQEEDCYGEVVFTAYYKQKKDAMGKRQAMDEHSVFKKINGKWFYTDSL